MREHTHESSDNCNRFHADASCDAHDGIGPSMRVLIVHPDGRRATTLAKRLTDCATICELALDGDAALAMLDHAVDVVLVADALPGDLGQGIAQTVQMEHLPARVILLARRPTLAKAMQALRCGMVDLLCDPPESTELLAAVVTAAEAAQQIRAEAVEIEQLRGMSSKFEDAHTKVADHLDALCDDLSKTCDSLAEHVDEMAGEAELATRIAGVLDIEVVLRAVLEHVLSKVGPTNAAIFLPGESGDFSLGAYVNYDCDKDTADVLLDHLADVLAPAFEFEDAVISLTSAPQQEEWLGDDASWLAEYAHLLITPCKLKDDCLALIALFREESAPFAPGVIGVMEGVRSVFTAQLDRIVRVHHRMAPRSDSPEWDNASDEEGGLAA